MKQQFKHVDDSLFAMSLRNPKIAEDVTKEIGNVHYNIDKSLETLVKRKFQKGVSHQQYTVSSANKLADFLSDILNGMQMSDVEAPDKAENQNQVKVKVRNAAARHH